ncbi:Acyl-CoA N-acyltransferase [Cordyceps fumosorosea ARSEF 2679]|uniref:Acyl-CoA N-acyltransferase n=1 Tax=Cordyceps fumosorosea (strain ARSEF 2679) TaxID=1081104 RepID=A0A167XES0_CORFA|nr:Acyl-CoA N-acyltransferase [Cordyceps fumosorosea ARSEF 2679]OAA64889.1 Acyl-CoA N-acyltransferase [Cordyceps fumosorosea ARSEF 2679]
MASLCAELKSRQWQRDEYLITTDSSVIPLDRLIDVFDSPEFYWASAMPREHMQAALDNSLCFSLFRDGDDEFLGFARCVTDYTTFVYLTDVWVDPAAQGRGLGSWLVRCVREVVEEMPHLRRSMLFTSSWERSVPFYRRLMGMEVVESTPGQGLITMECKGRGHPRYGSEGSHYG